MPYVEGLSRRFPLEGILYGREEWKGLPFPVKRGNRELKERYGLQGVPALVILKDGMPRMRLHGVADIKDAEFFINAFSKGAKTPSEIMADEAEHLLTGWLIHRGEYFKGGFFITDKEKEIPVKPWLPVEAVKSPFKKERPLVMSDLIKRPVLLRGMVKKTDKGYIFYVKEMLTWKE